jgi:CarboxypepD_reg-like domain/TonB-dependent Receptor Plug Domain
LKNIYLLLALVCLLVVKIGWAQKKYASVTGKVVDENERFLGQVSITILGKQNATQLTNDSGFFKINVPAEKAFALVFTYAGYKEITQSFFLVANEEEYIQIKMEKTNTTLKEVIVTDNKSRREAGLTIFNPKVATNIPSPGDAIANLIKIIGLSPTNELSSNYSIRGGNYDENLIYVNDFEIFRPYLVRNGQQEGLSFINPELARNVNFYNGGFQAKYGDKMSSVLDVQYKRPKYHGGSAYVGLLEQGVHIEGAIANERFTYLLGARNRSNRNLLSSQEVKGNYVPNSSDVQALLTYKLTEKSSIDFLLNRSTSTFSLTPQSSQQQASVYSPLFQLDIALNTVFEGQEEDGYRTTMTGLSLSQQPRKNLRLKWMLSRFENDETEAFDITGYYIFGERQFDKSKPDFGQITNPLGAGVFQNYARNKLNIQLYNFTHKGNWSER